MLVDRWGACSLRSHGYGAAWEIRKNARFNLDFTSRVAFFMHGVESIEFGCEWKATFFIFVTFICYPINEEFYNDSLEKLLILDSCL